MQRDPASRRARRIWTAFVIAVIFAFVIVVAVVRWLPDDPPAGQVWMATPGTAARLYRFDPRVANLYFDRGEAIVLNGGWEGATAGQSWASLDGFLADLDAGDVSPDIEVVMYDPERWSATPEDEQRNPYVAMRTFAAVARAHGYERVVLTPHPNLTQVPGGVCHAFPNEPIAEAYIRCGIPYAAADVADVVVLQTQFLQEQPEIFGAVTAEAAAQARATDRDVTVLSVLSTRYADDAHIMLNAWDAVRDVVEGHYLAVPRGVRPLMAARFLSLLAERRG